MTEATSISERVDRLDIELFSSLESQTIDWDRRALLALHSAVAEVYGSFAYLEIGSYLGGSLQAVMRDRRCSCVMSIDSRPSAAPDARSGQWEYEDNSTEHMLQRLQTLPDADLAKLRTFETSTDQFPVSALPARPNYCFIDGEHTHDAVLRDVRFCAEAISGSGVIAFHDYVIVGSAIASFLRENWRDITFAVAFTGPVNPHYGGGVFALELGDRGILRRSVIDDAISSRWHSVVWKGANRVRRSALPFLLAWAVMPAVDSFVVHMRHGLRQYVRLDE